MSNIDLTVPPEGEATTLAVRNNFATAASEIDAATAAAAAAQATANSKLSDAPNNGGLYARMNAAWTLVPAPPQASTTLPAMNGAAAIGTGNTWARADHVHPSDTAKLSLTGGTLTGPLIAAADPTVALGVATKGYVDSKGGIADAPSDGTAYGRLNASWVHVVTTFNSRTGAVALTSGDVTGALGYTPANRAGDTITGNFTVNGLLSTSNLSVSAAINAGSLVVAGAMNAGTLQATSYFAAALGGWAYTSTGGGASSGTFNFGISGGSWSVAGLMFFAASDRRLKENITPITADDGMEWVQKARPVTFVKIGSPGAGFISQEQIAAGYGQFVATMPYEGLEEETDQAGVRSMADVALYLDNGNYVAYLTAALQSVLQRLAVVEAALAAKS